MESTFSIISVVKQANPFDFCKKSHGNHEKQLAVQFYI